MDMNHSNRQKTDEYRAIAKQAHAAGWTLQQRYAAIDDVAAKYSPRANSQTTSRSLGRRICRPAIGQFIDAIYALADRIWLAQPPPRTKRYEEILRHLCKTVEEHPVSVRRALREISDEL